MTLRVILNYAPARWVNLDTTPAQRAGAWSQTVWQTDALPRYGGIGVWAYDDGVARWTSDYTMRPLARRDAVRHPVYDHYMAPTATPSRRTAGCTSRTTPRSA